MTAATCPGCARPVKDGLLCQPCTDLFERTVTDLNSWLPELETVVLRQDQVARGIRHRAATGGLEQEAERREHHGTPAWLRSRDGRAALPKTAMPVNLDAADLLIAVRFTLATWVAELRQRNTDAVEPLEPGRLLGPVCAAHVHDLSPGGCAHRGCRRLHCRHRSCQQVRRGLDPVDPACAWLLRNVRAVRRDQGAGRLLADLHQARRNVEAAIDIREPDMYLGPCDAPDVRATVVDGVVVPVAGICGTDLFGQLGDPVVTCTVCGWRFRVEERREWLLEAARDVWARPALIASALTSMGMPLTAGRLDQWISRDKRDREAGRAVMDEHARWVRVRDGAPLIFQVATEFDDENGRPVVDEQGRPLGRPMYRVGDVAARMDWMNQRTEATG